MASVPIKAANKTFRVSRQPQYKRNRASNPLTPLNQERTSRRSVSIKEKNSQSVYPEIPQALPKAVYDDLKNTSSQNKSPVVLLVPADRFLDAMDKENISSVSLHNVDYKENRVLNKTLSPIGTPERFSIPLMTRFQSPLPVICTPIKDGISESTTQTLSVKDALAVINSDLLCPVSPPNACSSLNLADSLESHVLSMDGDLETSANTVRDVSPQIDIAQQRLTFFVKSNKVLENKSGPEGLMHSPAACSASDTKFYYVVGDAELNQKCSNPKKILFNSATVIKSKACVSPEHSPSPHKTQTFRRRLLQKAPLGPESNTSVLSGVSILPIINSVACVNFTFNGAPLVETEPKLSPQQPTFPEQPPASTGPAEQLVLTFKDENNVSATSSDSHALDLQILPLHVSKDMFPVQSRATTQNRKRKSEEYLKDSSECLEVKRSSEVTQERKKSCHEKQFSSRCKQIQRKIGE